MKIKWYGDNEGSIWYMLKFLIEFVIKLDEYQVYHSDIKNQNLVCVFDWRDRVLLKVIDLGGCSLDYVKISSYTKKYMPSVAKAIEKDNKFEFDNR